MAIRITIFLDQPKYNETEQILRDVLKDALSCYSSYSNDKVFIDEREIAELKIENGKEEGQ